MVFKVINVPRNKLVHITYFNIRTTINGQYFYKYVTPLLRVSVYIVHLQGGD